MKCIIYVFIYDSWNSYVSDTSHLWVARNSQAKWSYQWMLANEDQETGKMRRWDELLLEVMSMSTRCQTTCFQTSVRTQDGLPNNGQKQRRITPRSLLLRWDHHRLTKKQPIFQRSLLFLHICIFLQVIKWHLFIRASLNCIGGVKVKKWRHGCPSDCVLLSFLGSCGLMACVIWRHYQDRKPNNLPLCWHIPIKSIFYLISLWI